MFFVFKFFHYFLGHHETISSYCVLYCLDNHVSICMPQKNILINPFFCFYLIFTLLFFAGQFLQKNTILTYCTKREKKTALEEPENIAYIIHILLSLRHRIFLSCMGIGGYPLLSAPICQSFFCGSRHTWASNGHFGGDGGGVIAVIKFWVGYRIRSDP